MGNANPAPMDATPAQMLTLASSAMLTLPWSMEPANASSTIRSLPDQPMFTSISTTWNSMIAQYTMEPITAQSSLIIAK